MTDKRMSKEDFDDEEEFYAKFPHAFRKGVSGNPAGRPKENANRKTVRQIAQEMDFCPIRTAIDLIKLPQAEAREKYNLEGPISTKDKAKLNMWIGDKMHSSLKSVDHTVLETDDNKDSGVLQIFLPAKSAHHAPKQIEVPVEAALDICKAQDPIELPDDTE
jgi:hypothetical protein